MKRTVYKVLFVGCMGWALHCTNELPLSDLVNNTITLKVLGTYESNTSYDVGTTTASLPEDDVITGTIAAANPAITIGTQVVTYAQSLKPSDIKYYIDIAEIRLAQGQGKSSSQTIADYWQQFAITRQLMCSEYGTVDARTLSNCADQNGINKLYEFFNGGFTYPAVDVAGGNYNHLGVYFRRFVTSPAVLFNTDGTYSSAAATFDNRTVYGLDVESLLQNPYGSTAIEPLMFPLQRKDLSLTVWNDYEPYVLEVRIFLKNLMMVHILQGVAQAPSGVMAYVGPADWNVNHAFSDTVNGGRQGGSALLAARMYQPSKVGSIQMSAVGNAGEYFAVTDSSVTLTTPTSILPLAATRATNTTITNLQPGTYNVYRTCDKQICSNSSAAGGCDGAAGTDGYPETVSLCTGGPYPVYAGTVTNVTLTNCNASCP